MQFKETKTDSNDFPGRVKVQDRPTKAPSLFQRLMVSTRTAYEEDRSLYAIKLAEIDYMLGVYDKKDFAKAVKKYESYTLSWIKKELSKRLNDFAEAETHRDFNCEYNG